jgi:hypothetical protein
MIHLFTHRFVPVLLCVLSFAASDASAGDSRQQALTAPSVDDVTTTQSAPRRTATTPATTAPAASSGQGESVDLNSLNTSSAAAAPQAPQASASGSAQTSAPSQTAAAYHGTSTAAPNFKVYFDLDFVNQPGLRDLTFDNYHSFLFFEISPTPDMQFSFDVNPAPRYYELDYMILPRLQARAGRIWIPWDDLSPHNIYGGRVNVSRLQAPGTAAFLPDLWTDLGVGLKWTAVDTMNLSVTDPSPITANDPTGYPNFSDSGSVADNNRNKAVGGRIHALLFKKLGLGASVYTGRWNNQDLDPQSMTMLGFDGQLRLGRTEFRAGVATMLINIPGASFNRGGMYGELGERLGAEGKVKLLGRVGLVQLDSRVIDITDQTIGGVTLLWQPGLIQYSIETSYDFNNIVGKPSRSYSAARLVVAF